MKDESPMKRTNTDGGSRLINLHETLNEDESELNTELNDTMSEIGGNTHKKRDSQRI